MGNTECEWSPRRGSPVSCGPASLWAVRSAFMRLPDWTVRETPAGVEAVHFERICSVLELHHPPGCGRRTFRANALATRGRSLGRMRWDLLDHSVVRYELERWHLCKMDKVMAKAEVSFFDRWTLQARCLPLEPHRERTDETHDSHRRISQIRLDTEGRAYYRRKRAEGKKPLEAIRCLKRRISDAINRQLIDDAQQGVGTVREGTAGRLKNPARSTCPAHRHFGSATSRTRMQNATPDRMTTEGSPYDVLASPKPTSSNAAHAVATAVCRRLPVAFC
jgi:hypothetical protein